MKLAVYSPAIELVRQTEALDLLLSSHDVHSVIIRSANPHAFELAKSKGLEAWWLAPGLWGNVDVGKGQAAVFPDVPGWKKDNALYYEGQWPMLCPTDPALPGMLADHYAATSRLLGADGIYGTHLRFHHPADISHLWGCVCTRCQEQMKRYGLSLEELQLFWMRLRQGLQSIPVESWATPAPGQTAYHRLVAWWASVADMDFPLRWFKWKNEVLGLFLKRLKEAYQATGLNHPWITNSFEPILAPLAGHHPDALHYSDWYSPLLGYWPTHLWQSVLNIALWHSRLIHSAEFSPVLSAFEQILGHDGAVSHPMKTLREELMLGKEISNRLGLPYWPVLNGTSQSLVPISIAMKCAEEAGACGIVLQGISQLLGNQALDQWF